MTTKTLSFQSPPNRAMVKAMNTISHISAYRLPYDRSFWCFDDARFGLKEELFLNGASDFISRIVGDSCEKAGLIFSTKPFPGQNAVLISEWSGILPDEKGCAYHGMYPTEQPGDPYLPSTVDEELWLCPAMCHYFGTDKAPDRIYAKITPAS